MNYIKPQMSTEYSVKAFGDKSETIKYITPKYQNQYQIIQTITTNVYEWIYSFIIKYKF